jgi:hypothetical protein
MQAANILAGKVGIEPTTNALTVHRTTAVLLAMGRGILAHGFLSYQVPDDSYFQWK